MPPPARAVDSATSRAEARTRLLLEAPITRTLVRLALPNLAIVGLQAGLWAADAWLIAWLGTDALAGATLVFPLYMLMQTMSSGGMGTGVMSAIARALGSGRHERAERLAVHALAIGAILGGAFTLVLLIAGPRLYAGLGGRGGALAAALAYSNVLFGGALAVWTFNTLANIVRGTGNMALPALVTAASAPLQLALSAALMFGWGPLPGLGVAGAALAAVVSHTAGAVVLAWWLAAGRGPRGRQADSPIRLRFAGVRPGWGPVRDIVRVGGVGAINTFVANVTQLSITALVATFGTAALAGYGVAARLEYMQIPAIFGLGTVVIAMVGTNVGAGQFARARRVAWTGAALAGLLTQLIGLAAALAPAAWVGLFTSDPAVLAAGAAYLRVVGPAHGCFGLGLTLYFAGQGAGRPFWSLVAGLGRLTVATLGGALLVRHFGAGPSGLFAMVALSFVVYAAVNAAALAGRRQGAVA